MSPVEPIEPADDLTDAERRISEAEGLRLAGYEALAASWNDEDEAVRAARRGDRGRRRNYTVHVAAIGESDPDGRPDAYVYLDCLRCPHAPDREHPRKIVPSSTDWCSIPVAELDMWIEQHEEVAHRA